MVRSRSYPINEIHYFSVRYTPIFQKSLDLENYCCGEMEEIYNIYDSLRYLIKFCSNSKYNLQYSQSIFTRQIGADKIDIDLLITFNHAPKAINIEFIKNFYGPYFRNIIFCGDKIISTLFHEAKGDGFKRFDSYTFIDLSDMIAGEYHYYCMTKAIEMGFNTQQGILLMSDDVLLKFWHLTKLDTDKVWFGEKILVGITVEFSKRWMWFIRSKGIDEILVFINEVADGKGNITKLPVLSNYPGIL